MGRGYLIPYQEDVEQAIQDLRQQAFLDGEHFKGFVYDEQGLSGD